ncbi:3,2-trans-enoyl-CoA isomerase, mitochondrial precursor [Angomonas deanei]|uniref:Enoyl-CoA delta isomerase 1, mitochondrial n=1 Tax=Angomonas deanei TaxID=59799 RepID=A0A7G2C4A4_9TRYP|nr:3,2-trans-enoyl-CoA isomerase, mitochondrial precursor [Angomonas deanei]CAD2213567.1 Enoyl-CoA hydratase/isomerase, putative [Angomonas deanei]|eukprot:EPY39403.1 3,2-trans-enoyl-CoA isomerase, mitochondrial precursor [Angomonas deanei]
MPVVAAAPLSQLRFQGSRPPQDIPQELRRPAGSDAAQGQPLGRENMEEAQFEPPQKPSEPPQFLKLSTNDKGIVTVQFARSPVNSLNLEFLQEFNQWMLWMGSNEETKAIVLTSAIPTVFSAGLDLSEVHNPQPQRFTQFWQSLQEMWLILNSFPKPIVAAVTGNSPAGGCIIAMGCDYRVMARGPKGNEDARRFYRIGLNETKLGFTAPAWTMPAYSYLLGSRQAERLLQLGETPTADEACKLGMVDLVVEDEQKCMESALQMAEKFLSVPQNSRWMSRDMMRREYLQVLGSEEDRNYDTEFTTQLISSPEVQQSLTTYMEKLKSRTRK